MNATPVQLLRVHRGASFLAFALLVLFWTSTILSEWKGELSWIRRVKTFILSAIPILVIAMAVAGITGSKLAPKAKKGVLATKRLRLQIMAGNGVLVLIPSAVALWWMISQSEPSSSFYSVQAIELIAGALNLTLLGLNIRDGLRLRRRRGSVSAG